MLRNSIQFLSLPAFWCLVTLVAGSCTTDDPEPNTQASDNAHINTWIYDQMQDWYLWNTELPAAPDKSQEPDEFFESLLSDDDRFSWIQPNYQDLLNSLKGITTEAGYEYALYKEGPSTSTLIAQILYVKPNTSAHVKGLKRGDIITHINGQQLNTSNYRDLIADLKNNHTVTYKPLIVEEKRFDLEQNISLSTSQYSENPNLLSKVIESHGRKIGYYAYTFFASGPSDDSQQYDSEMDAIFANFKSEGITDLVLDLRFNSGGSESSAANLASLIGRSISSTKVFARREYNSYITAQIKDDPKLGEGFLTTKFKDKDGNVGSMLRDGRIYILTGSRTASASELVINSLKPYMEVFIIGDTTYGKNVGSISLYEEEDPKIKWGMQPIVVKVYNSLNQSDYGTGFYPNIVDKDNALHIYSLGDPRETLLQHAIAKITGVFSEGRVRPEGETRTMIGHSLDANPRSFNLIIDRSLNKQLNN